MSASDFILLYDPEDSTKNVTVETYQKWCSDKNKSVIADFIYERHYRRYIKPFEFDDPKFKKCYKNGFFIMANCCL